MKQGLISRIAPLLILGMFALTVLSAVASFASGYERLSVSAHESYARSTAFHFVKTKLQSASSPQAVSIESFGGADCIAIRELYGSTEYVTRLYCHGGMLRELFTPADLEFSPEDGETVVALDGLSACEQDGFLYLRLKLGGEETVLLHPKEVS